MRIALLSTCALATPPVAYGGTELVVAEIAHGLVELGHEVCVLATADSRPAGRLCACSPHPVWPPNDLAELRHAAMGWKVIASGGFDVVHVHHAAAIALNHVLPVGCVLTVHHVREPGLLEHYLSFPEIKYVAISHRQAELSPELQFVGTVHHGLDPANYPLGMGRPGYGAFLARLAPEKAPHLAIEAARRAGVPIRIAGQPHDVAKDLAYFETEVLPMLEGAEVEMVGELSLAPKVALLQGARALLMPIDWEEPFGLNMIEAMLVGTPVIAFGRGSVPEMIDEGLTGFVVDTVDQMADRLLRLEGFDRRACRRRAIERWSYLRMARDYLNLYERVRRGAREASRPYSGAEELEGH